MSWLGPTMGNGILGGMTHDSYIRSELCINASTYLYNTWSDAGTGRYHAGDTSFVNDKVAN